MIIRINVLSVIASRLRRVNPSLFSPDCFVVPPRNAGQVSEKIATPCTFSGFIYPAFGFRFGKNNNPWVNVEFQFPGYIIAERPHAFVHPDFGLGMQFSVQFPLNKTTK